MKNNISLNNNFDSIYHQEDLNDLSQLYKSEDLSLGSFEPVYESTSQNFLLKWDYINFKSSSLKCTNLDICKINSGPLSQLCSLSFSVNNLNFGNFLNEFIENSFNSKHLLLNTLHDISIVDNSFTNGDLMLNLASKLTKRFWQLFQVLKKVQKASYLNWLLENKNMKCFNELSNCLHKDEFSNITIPENLVKMLSAQFTEFAYLSKFECFRRFIYNSKIREKLRVKFPDKAKVVDFFIFFIKLDNYGI